MVAAAFVAEHHPVWSIPVPIEFGKAAAKIRAAGMSLESAKDSGRFIVEDNLARQFDVPRFVITDRTDRDRLWP